MKRKGGFAMQSVEIKTFFSILPYLKITPPFRFAQHLPCMGGKEKFVQISRLPGRVAKRRDGSELTSGGRSEPERDRAAARRCRGSSVTEGLS